MRVVFMGTPDFAVPTLTSLLCAHQVAGVVTQPDRRKGRGKAMAFSPVKEKAIESGVPVFQPEKVRDPAFLEELKRLDPEVIVVAAFGQILPEAVLTLPKYGCINVHASLLPKYRGAAPIQKAIIDGEKETGVTIMYMEKGLDTGDMIDQCVVPIDPRETGASLHDKLAAAGGPLLLRVLKQIEDGTAVRTPQDDEKSTYAGVLTKELGQIDWTMSARAIERLIRALTPWPSAYTHYKDKTLKLWDADVGSGEAKAAPGTVTGVSRDQLEIACGNGILLVNEVQLQGKKRMPVHDFLLGNPLEEGIILT